MFLSYLNTITLTVYSFIKLPIFVALGFSLSATTLNILKDIFIWLIKSKLFYSRAIDLATKSEWALYININNGYIRAGKQYMPLDVILIMNTVYSHTHTHTLPSHNLLNNDAWTLAFQRRNPRHTNSFKVFLLFPLK